MSKLQTEEKTGKTRLEGLGFIIATRTREAISKEVRAGDYPPLAPKILQRQFDDVAGNRGPRLQKLGLEPVVEGDVLRALHIAHRLHLQMHGLRLQRSLL